MRQSEPGCRDSYVTLIKSVFCLKRYSLGPNGAIITSLNLFTTKFEQVMNLIDKRANEIDYVLFDTPGQIEVFTWSASGSIITESLVIGNAHFQPDKID